MEASNPQHPAPNSPPTSLRELAALFGWLGTIGFGGPAAHIALMEDAVVTRRGWLPRARFLDMLALTNLIPGPNSSEMAIHIGWARAGRWGALVAGLAFLLPSFVLMVILSALYFTYGTMPQVAAFFYGIKPVAVALVAGAAWRLAKTAAQDWIGKGLLVAGAAVAVLAPDWELLLLLAAGVVGWAWYGRAPRPQRMAAWVAPVLLLAALAATNNDLVALAWVFLKAGTLLFGGGYVMIPLTQPEVVHTYGWLTEQQFLDGVALGQTTPGPIVTTAAFVGYRVAGVLGAVIATAAIYLPAFTFVLATAPLLARIGQAGNVRAALKGINAVVAGAVAGAAISLGLTAVGNPPTRLDLPATVLLLVALVLVFRTKIPAVLLIAGGGLLGFVLSALR